MSVTGALTCPFTNVSFLIGADRLSRLTIRNPEAVHRLCEVSLQSNLLYAQAIMDIGCLPSLTDAMSSCSVISPKQFKEFSFPYLKRLIAYIHSRGKPVTLHICGKTAKIWKRWLMPEQIASVLTMMPTCWRRKNWLGTGSGDGKYQACRSLCWAAVRPMSGSSLGMRPQGL